MESSVETAGLSTGFIVILGIAYRILKNSNFQFSSSCRERLVREASYEIREKVKDAVEAELSKSRATSPTNLGESKLHTPQHTATAPTLNIHQIPDLPPTPLP